MSWKSRRSHGESLNQAELVIIAGESELDVQCLFHDSRFSIDIIPGDGSQMRDRVCSLCVANKLECTYRNPAPPRTLSNGYVKSLEERLAKVEALLKKICPDNDFAEELGFPLQSLNPPSTKSLVNMPFTPATTFPILSSTGHGMDDDTPPLSDDEILGPVKLSRMGLLKQSDDEAPILFGKSSVVDLMQRMCDVQSDVSGAPRRHAVRYVRQGFDWMTSWTTEHQLSIDVLRYCLFPETDLMARLVESYFSEYNIIFPLLHRPTFERALRAKFYLSDGGFARVLLLVCAVGSRYVDDPRVLLDNGARHSAGWKWFEQAQISKLHLLVTPTLYDMQAHCLSIEYLHSSSTPQVCWSMTAIGIRMIQDVGANRRAVYGEKPNASDELWKRVFWLLVFYDRFHSTGVGRSCAIPEEDYDVDPPIDCDDEYWEHEDPERAFKQPPGKPSTIAAFVAFTRLQFITALALRTLFSLSRSKAALGLTGPSWEQDMVAKLDSALNMWLDAIPEHLRWNTGKEIINEIFYRQSNLLQCGYYLVQITIHRQFVTSRGEFSPLTVSSRAVCRSAARACIEAMHKYIERGFSVIPEQLPLAFMSGLILMLSMWGRTLSDSVYGAQQDTKTIMLCIELLDRCEPRYYIAGRQSHDLRELASFEGIPRWLTSLRTLGANAHGTGLSVSQTNPHEQMHRDQSNRDTHVVPSSKPPEMGSREHRSDRSEDTKPLQEEDVLVHATALMNENGSLSQMTPGEIAMWSSAPSAGWSEEWDIWIKNLSHDEPNALPVGFGSQ